MAGWSDYTDDIDASDGLWINIRWNGPENQWTRTPFSHGLIDDAALQEWLDDLNAMPQILSVYVTQGHNFGRRMDPTPPPEPPG